MSKRKRKSLDKSSFCYLYWIRSPEHGSITQQGYVGITHNFDMRLSQHLHNASSEVIRHNYKEAFKEALSQGDYIAEVVLVGSREYCLNLERKLRPKWDIGWNLAKGGGGGYGTHGLTRTKIYGTYHRMIAKARESGEEVCSEWLGEYGVAEFADFYENLPEEGEMALKVVGGGFNPENLTLESRSEILRRSNRKHLLEGNLWSVAELSEKFGLTANTITWRLLRGCTVEEAVGLKKRVVEKEENIDKELAIYFLKNSPMIKQKVADRVGLGKSCLVRQLKGYKIPKWLFDFCELPERKGVKWRRIKRSRLFDDFEDILLVEEAYLGGEPVFSIAKRLGVDHGAIKRLLEELESAEYF